MKSTKDVVRPLQVALRRSQLRRRLRASVAGMAPMLTVDLGDAELDPASVFLEVTRHEPSGSPLLARLVAALQASGGLAALMDGLTDDDPGRQGRCAHLAGALRLEMAVPWLGMLLHVRERQVRMAAARALGRIGGWRSADLLVAALTKRKLPPSRLAIELSRAAPDLYIESILASPHSAAARAQLAAAAGLRGRRSSLEALRRLALDGTERERATACRALGLIGDPAASPELCIALEHRAWRVRRAATRALGVIGDRSRLPELQERLYDPHPSTRYAAARALRLVKTGRRK